MINFLTDIFAHVMDFCYGLLPNWIAAIALFTLLTKLLLLPVSLWSNRNGLKMVSILPRVNRIKAEFYGDRERIDEATAAMYKQTGYHPLLTMVPLAIQIIVLLGLIGVIHRIADTGTAPGLGLVPVTDGGAAWLMPLAAAGAAVILSLAQNRVNPLQREQSRPEQLVTNGISVGISLVLGAFVSVGVALYWSFSNLMTIGVQLLCNLLQPPKNYVDYADLAASREELRKLDSMGPTQTKELKAREKADYKRFFSVVNKKLVFYSEGSGFYKYFQNIISELLRRSNVTIHYITSDPNDQIFAIAKSEPRIHPYYIGERRMITMFMKLDADIVCMTMPDLETYQYKRSYVRRDIEYVYIFHGMFSGLVTLRSGALDHFDTLLTPTPGFEEEMRAWNRVHGLPDQRMVPCGYGVIDNMAAQYDAMETTDHDPKTVLIAPSWQEGNVLDSCLADLAEPLLAAGYDITVRPHPQYLRRFPQRFEAIKSASAGYAPDRFRFQTDFSSNETVFSADILVTDWSNIGYEYAVATKKPVLFVNTPRKLVNDDWTEEDVKKYAPDDNIRSLLGVAVEPEAVRDRAASIAGDMLAHREDYADVIESVRRERLYHFGESGVYGAKYLLGRILENQKKAKE